MKTFIFLTSTIEVAGGCQCYVARKAEYLESEGWNVLVVSPGYKYSKKKCLINSLNKYRRNHNHFIGVGPHRLISIVERWGMHNMMSMINEKWIEGAPIVIESHDSSTAMWGELLAKRYGAQHVFWGMNEDYRGGYGGDALYLEKIDLFKFKFYRKEIFCSYDVLQRLFEGILNIEQKDAIIPWIDEDPFQDVNYEKVDEIKKSDYNICHIGRGEKKYVPYVLDAVGKFADKHPDSTVQLINVGNLDCLSEKVASFNIKHPNSFITELGYLFPLPKNLIEKVNIIIACSGTARHSAEEGALVVVADAETGASIGLLGYDTNSSIYSDGHHNMDIEEDLERGLVKKVHLDMNYTFPPKRGVEECTKQNFCLQEQASQIKEYYDEKKLLSGKKNVGLSIKIVLLELIDSFRISSFISD